MTIPADTPKTSAELERELAAAKRETEAIRELMNIYNLGGWTDAIAPMKRALAAYKRLAKLEPDAERYRWLRDHHRSPMSEIRIAMSIGHDWIDPESHELDAAIDAARAKDKPLWNGYDDGLPHHNR